MLDLNKLYKNLEKYIHIYDIFESLDMLNHDLAPLTNILLKKKEELYNIILEELSTWSLSAKKEIIHTYWWHRHIFMKENDLKKLSIEELREKYLEE